MRRIVSWPGRLLLTVLASLWRFVRNSPGWAWSGLKGLGRLVRSLPGRAWSGLKGLGSLVRRFVRSLLDWLWRGIKGLLRFVASLPGRLWRGFVSLLRFVISLPGRLWRGFMGLLRFVAALPGHVRRIPARMAAARERLRRRWGQWRARLAARIRAIRPREWSPWVLATAANWFVIVLLGLTSLLLWQREPASVVVTLTPTRARVSSRPIRTTPTPASLIASTPSPTPTLAIPFGGGGAVAFGLHRNGNSDIYARKLDDEGLLRLTFHPAEDREPAWAPDGETLAFASHRGNNWDIYRLDLVSGMLLRLTREPHYDGHPTWSHDGAFVAFESLRSGNLDIFIMAADGSQVLQLTSNGAADFAPAWSPDGRHIAFVSYRDGSKDIFLYPLDAGTEEAVVNLTQTPDQDEDAPTWSPDGSRLAFSVGRLGEELIYITTFDWSSKFLDEAQTQLFNPGTHPDWSPDGSSLIYEYRRAGQSYLIADNVSGWGEGREVFRGESQPREPSWSALRADPQTLAAQRQTAPLAASALYIEEISPRPESGPPHSLVPLRDVNGGDDREFLSDRVNNSFAALRQRVLQETGVDYLASIGDSARPITAEPPPGQSPRSWHKAGRAVDLNQGLYERDDQLVELVREDIGFRTYWRVYLRAAQQDGSLGEPLRQAPWDLKARGAGGLSAREGGELRQETPPGYYVDFTALAADYGWERVPANNRWRYRWEDVNWWQFQKTQGLSWLEAMLELYRLDEVEAVFGPLGEEGDAD